MVHIEQEKKKIYSELISSDACEVLKEVKTIIDRVATTSGIDPDQSFDIRVILNELLNNAIKHGNAMDKNKKIHVDVWLQDKSRMLEICVSDQGCGFDVDNTMCCKRDAMSKCDPLVMDESGRGLFIVQSLCDYMAFNSLGNAITIRKRLDPS